MSDEHLRISIGDGEWSFWDYVKVVVACIPLLVLITLVALLPVLVGGNQP